MTKTRLTDLQMVLLSAAAARPDFMLLPPPESVRAKGKTLERALARLLEADLVEEVTARNDAETWRETEDGWSFGLRIAPAGLEAIGLPGRVAEDADEEPAPAEAPETQAASDAPMPEDSDAGAAKGDIGAADDAAPATPLFRAGTKQARLAELISTPEGAGIEALSQALGWQVHTTRAALTGLRKKGLPVEAAKGDDGKTVYRFGRTEAGSDET